MSGGPACACTGAFEDRSRNWRVLDYKCNYSAFNGYHRTLSDYSSVVCNGCNRVWRTKAKFVDSLPRANHERYVREGKA